MSSVDLHVLADAIAFALLVSVGGLLAYAILRFAWRRWRLRSGVALGIPVAAALLIGGFTLWPPLREGVNDAAGVDLDEEGQVIVTGEQGSPAGPAADVAADGNTIRPGREWQVAPSASAEVTDPVGATGAGSVGSDGGGDPGGDETDPTPTDDPSATVEPPPTNEPPPTIDPSPSEEPSPTEEPSPSIEPPGDPGPPDDPGPPEDPGPPDEDLPRQSGPSRHS
jgi:hypothetical protein